MAIILPDFNEHTLDQLKELKTSFNKQIDIHIGNKSDKFYFKLSAGNGLIHIYEIDDHHYTFLRTDDTHVCAYEFPNITVRWDNTPVNFERDQNGNSLKLSELYSHSTNKLPPPPKFIKTIDSLDIIVRI